MSHDSAEHGIQMEGELDWDDDTSTHVHNHPDFQLCKPDCPAFADDKDDDGKDG